MISSGVPMALKKMRLKTTIEHQGKRLDDVLTQWLSSSLDQAISKGKARKLIVAGAVYLNSKRVRIASKELRQNAWIDVFSTLRSSTQALGIKTFDLR